jgi:hypothetical protein
VIGETDFTSGPSTLHEKAIYIVEGQLYPGGAARLRQPQGVRARRRVRLLHGRDHVHEVTILETFAGATGTDRYDGYDGYDRYDRYTRAAATRPASMRIRAKIRPSRTRDCGSVRDAAAVRPLAARGAGGAHGEVHVGLARRRFQEDQVLYERERRVGELDLPEQQMHTTSYWVTIPGNDGEPAVGPGRVGATACRPGVRDAQRGAAASDVRFARSRLSIDGLAVEGANADGRTSSRAGPRRPRLSAAPTIFIYDNYPGGIGFSEPLHFDARAAHRADARPDRRLPVQRRAAHRAWALKAQPDLWPRPWRRGCSASSRPPPEPPPDLIDQAMRDLTSRLPRHRPPRPRAEARPRLQYAS